MTRRAQRDSGMGCRQVRELLPLYVDGDLESVREALVARHLASCPACRERAGLDRELAERLAAFAPAADLAARGVALRREVMEQVEKEHRRRPWRRMALRLGNAATWLMVSAVAVALVLAIAVTWRPLAERAWPAAAPTPVARPATPEHLFLCHNGQADLIGPSMGVFGALAAEVERALAGVRPGVAAVDDPAQEAARIKAQQVAIEAVYPAPGVRAGGDGPYTKVLIPLDAPESAGGLTILLGNDGYTRAAATDAGEALEMLRRILGVRQPEAGPPELGAAQDLFTLPASAGSYRVSPDGQWVLYMVPHESRWGMRLEARATASAEVVRLEVDGEVELPGESQLAWFPDSRRVLVATPGEQGRLLIATLDGQAETLARAPQGSLGYCEVAISPDGWQIAYTVLHASVPLPLGRAAIEVIDADGSGRRQIVAPEGSVSRLAYATGPGGANLFYFQDGKTCEVGADNAPAPALPQPVAEGMRGVAWSPGNTLALWLSEPDDEDGRADLYLGAWPVAREPTLVARGVDTRSVAWAGSDEWFVYSQNGALYLAQASGEAAPRRLTPGGERADTPVWAPGQGLLYRARRGGWGYVLRLLPLAGGTPEPREPDTAGLTVEEHAVAAAATGFPTDVEGTQWIGPAILDRRRAWREPSPATRVVATNEALRPFGYRLEAKEKPGWSQTVCDLLRGSEVIVPDVVAFWPVSVSAMGDDLAMVVEPLNGPYQLVRPTGTEEWDAPRHQYQPPIFVGRDLVSVTGILELRNVTVWRGSLPVYTSFTGDWGASLPIKGLWSWQGHWVLEVSGRVVVDGEDLNRELEYDEIFGYRLIKGRPFYFFEQGGRVGVSYDGVTLPQQYEEVLHYGCCSAAAYNPGGNDTMTWFFGLRDGTWYYVEMGRYDAEEAPI